MDNIEETAKKKKPMPPGAAQQLAGVPKPNNALVPVEGTRTVNPDPLGRAPRLVGGAANPVPAAAPAGPLPNYRTGAPAGQPQFQQTPTPVNPQVRSAAAQLGSVPESSAASTLAKPSVVGRAGNALKAIPGGRVVAPVAALLEGSQVVEKIRDPKASALDVAVQGARGVARTALGGAGAIAGTPGGLGGSAAGGMAGYELADRVIDAGTGERYGPMAKAFQDTFDNRHALYAGDVGIGINPKLAERVREADLIIALGVRLGEMTTGGYTLLQVPRPAQKSTIFLGCTPASRTALTGSPLAGSWTRSAGCSMRVRRPEAGCTVEKLQESVSSCCGGRNCTLRSSLQRQALPPACTCVRRLAAIVTESSPTPLAP